MKNLILVALTIVIIWAGMSFFSNDTETPLVITEETTLESVEDQINNLESLETEVSSDFEELDTLTF